MPYMHLNTPEWIQMELTCSRSQHAVQNTLNYAEKKNRKSTKKQLVWHWGEQVLVEAPFTFSLLWLW